MECQFAYDRRVIRTTMCAKTFPCPHCGQRGRRQDTPYPPDPRLAYGAILVIGLIVGEYRARCRLQDFRSQIPGIERGRVHQSRREAVIDRLLDEG